MGGRAHLIYQRDGGLLSCGVWPKKLHPLAPAMLTGLCARELALGAAEGGGSFTGDGAEAAGQVALVAEA